MSSSPACSLPERPRHEEKRKWQEPDASKSWGFEITADTFGSDEIDVHSSVSQVGNHRKSIKAACKDLREHHLGPSSNTAGYSTRRTGRLIDSLSHEVDPLHMARQKVRHERGIVRREKSRAKPHSRHGDQRVMQKKAPVPIAQRAIKEFLQEAAKSARPRMTVPKGLYANQITSPKDLEFSSHLDSIGKMLNASRRAHREEKIARKRVNDAASPKLGHHTSVQDAGPCSPRQSDSDTMKAAPAKPAHEREWSLGKKPEQPANARNAQVQCNLSAGSVARSHLDTKDKSSQNVPIKLESRGVQTTLGQSKPSTQMGNAAPAYANHRFIDCTPCHHPGALAPHRSMSAPHAKLSQHTSDGGYECFLNSTVLDGQDHENYMLADELTLPFIMEHCPSPVASTGATDFKFRPFRLG